jgi:hypothetical protein
VLAANETSPPYVAVRKDVPGGSRFVVMFAVPPVRVNGVPFGKLAVGGELPIDARIVLPSLASAFSETTSVPAGPVGVGVTVTLAVKVWPEGVPPLGLASVVVVVVRIIELQRVSRFPTLIDPSPVARSYPVPAVYAGFPLESTRIPYVAPPVTLQLELLPLTQATELFPVVMS